METPISICFVDTLAFLFGILGKVPEDPSREEAHKFLV